MKMIRLLFLSTMVIGCTGIPDRVTAVRGFELDRYLGTWYEIARLDHRFERGLNDVTATYTLREDEGINVVNRGCDRETGEWQQVDGRAYFIGDSDQGRLKVSFFGPFYSSYNIIALDLDDYNFALVSGPTRDYLWILSREPGMDSTIRTTLIEHAKTLGYDTDSLIEVKQAGYCQPE